jgi:hypothetical protein
MVGVASTPQVDSIQPLVDLTIPQIGRILARFPQPGTVTLE